MRRTLIWCGITLTALVGMALLGVERDREYALRAIGPCFGAFLVLLALQVIMGWRRRSSSRGQIPPSVVDASQEKFTSPPADQRTGEGITEAGRMQE